MAAPDVKRMVRKVAPQPNTRMLVTKRKGTISAVNTDGTVDVDLGGAGSDITAHYLADMFPIVGDTVSVLADDYGDKIVVGSHTNTTPRVQYRYKTTTETLTNSTTLQTDNELEGVEVTAGGAYIMELFVMYASGTSEDFSFRVTAASGTPTFLHSGFATSNAATSHFGDSDKSIRNYGTTRDVSGVGAGQVLLLNIEGTWVADVTTTVDFEWAQRSSGGTTTEVRHGSWWRCTRIA